MNGKKVLILCDMFPPAFGPRMGYLCKYLRRAGWEPTVVTEDLPDGAFAFLKGDTEVVPIRYYRAGQPFVRKLEWGCLLLLDVLFGCKDRRMYRGALKLVGKHAYRLVLCSTYRTFPLPAARRIARKAGLPLAVDLRDIVEQGAGNEFIAHSLPRLWGLEKRVAALFLKHGLKRRNRVLRDAACITTVSPWHAAFLKTYNARVELIYNGYDPELFYPAHVRSERFCITYTGRVINTALRNPGLLFEAVARLAAERAIAPDTFRLCWYTDEKSRQLVAREAGKHGLAEYMDFCGYVPASRIPEALNRSAILLLLTNRAGEAGPNGIMTTKFFEALAVGKPILCVRGDEGCLEETILRTRSGLSAHRAEEVYRFIQTHYRQWQLTGETGVDANREEVGKFSRQAQAGQFIRIFEQIASQPPDFGAQPFTAS
jgi:glycosyltransferase involved in cell wall biosynthesis